MPEGATSRDKCRVKVGKASWRLVRPGRDIIATVKRAVSETEVTSPSEDRTIIMRNVSSGLLQVAGLTVRYAPKASDCVLALDNVDLQIEPGEVVGLIGESGSGKSTLAATILRLLPKNAECLGKITFEGKDLLSLGESDLRRVRGARISLIPQDPAICLNPVLRVGTQISEVLRAHLPITRKERKQRVYELLKEVGFQQADAVASSYPHQLSGGERQRVVIAQAIACGPALVIADEPISKLDAALQMDILTLMSGIVRRHNTALLWITHDPATLAGFADRIAVMYRGQIVEDAEAERVFSHPSHAYTQQLMEAAEELSLS